MVSLGIGYHERRVTTIWSRSKLMRQVVVMNDFIALLKAFDECWFTTNPCWLYRRWMHYVKAFYEP